jgi:hypothetical protein
MSEPNATLLSRSEWIKQDLGAAINEKFTHDQSELIEAEILGPPERLEKARERMKSWERFFAAVMEEEAKNAD